MEYTLYNDNSAVLWSLLRDSLQHIGSRAKTDRERTLNTYLLAFS